MQAEDGSFTNVLGTVHALPALIGALPYDVADLPCPKGDKGQAEVFAIIVIKPYFIQYGFTILETCREHSSSGSSNTHHTHTRTHARTRLGCYWQQNLQFGRSYLLEVFFFSDVVFIVLQVQVMSKR